MADSPPPVVAAFDLDGTLTEGGSVFAWLRFVAGTSRANRAALRLAVPLIIGAIRSGRSADNAKERLFHALLRGRDLGELTASSRAFALEHLASEGRPPIVARLTWHLEQGHDVVVVSASPQIYVEVMAEALHAHGALGTRLAIDARGKLTGGYLGRNCRGSEKMRRLDEWIEQRHYPEGPVVYAYGNSRGDRRLLSRATYPFNAGQLGRIGSLRRFPRFTGE
jgi:phosphatidylglycerophosphatase C